MCKSGKGQYSTPLETEQGDKSEAARRKRLGTCKNVLLELPPGVTHHMSNQREWLFILCVATLYNLLSQHNNNTKVLLC